MLDQVLFVFTLTKTQNMVTIMIQYITNKDIVVLH